jgi:antitoxin VapB
MSKRAKLFQNGGSQAVRLPAEYRIEGDEVQIEQIGNTLVLRPVKPSWSEFFSNPVKAADDFMEDRGDEPPQERELF